MPGRLIPERLAVGAPRAVAAAFPLRPRAVLALAAVTFALGLAVQVVSRRPSAPIRAVAPAQVIEPRQDRGSASANLPRTAPLPAISALPAARPHRVRSRAAPRGRRRSAIVSTTPHVAAVRRAQDTAPEGGTADPVAPPRSPAPTRPAPVAQSPAAAPPPAQPSPTRQQSFDQSGTPSSGDFDTSGGSDPGAR